ncbi:uncharacterized protein G2W53_016352 [Senna tora]|uniref:Uncharacterized protein n=1 Tax=Senna tora TaxID=362788 RepID=A0A834TMS8_9FABA|nr:uncharacterized protein G2W53_016352 [Senna tora]
MWSSPAGFPIEEMERQFYQCIFYDKTELEKFRCGLWGLPPHCRSEGLATKLGGLVGEVMEVGLYIMPGENVHFMKALVRFDMKYLIRKVGHNDTECKKGKEDGSIMSKKLGPWIRAKGVGKRVDMGMKKNNRGIEGSGCVVENRGGKDDPNVNSNMMGGDTQVMSGMVIPTEPSVGKDASNVGKLTNIELSVEKKQRRVVREKGEHTSNLGHQETLFTGSYKSFGGAYWDQGDPKWRCTSFYGESMTGQRDNGWEMLKRLKDRESVPWIVLGDFNEVLSQDEHRSA